MMKVSFNDAYKEWRNQARKYQPESIVNTAMRFLCEPTANTLEDIQRAPWQVLLLVKWVCQDKSSGNYSSDVITTAQFYDLRQRLWKLPERVRLGVRDTLPGTLFFRQLLHSQIGFQRRISPGFVREAALLASLAKEHPLRHLFETKVGLGITDFVDLSFSTYVAIMEGKRQIHISWFNSLRRAYGDQTIDDFISCTSRTYPELVAFCRALPDTNTKVASEFFEFPVLCRYPFMRTENMLECWHPAVFYRGMEGFVHNVLSEEGEDYIHSFSKLFEEHVVKEAQKLDAPFFGESALKNFLPVEAKVPDGLLSFSDCNIFIESKAGIFDEPVMTVGHSEIFANKTKALQKAIMQGWSASVGLRSEGRAPQQVINAKRDYLLIITNKELSASRGTALASMYPPGALDYPNPESERFLPLTNIYVLSIEDFERLISGSSTMECALSSILNDCVEADQKAETSVHFFEQHLDRMNIPRKYSELVANALDTITIRLSKALGSDNPTYK